VGFQVLIDSRRITSRLEKEHEKAIVSYMTNGKKAYEGGLVDGFTRAILLVKMIEDEKSEEANPLLAQRRKQADEEQSV
jgi:hypothetical protein